MDGIYHFCPSLIDLWVINVVSTGSISLFRLLDLNESHCRTSMVVGIPKLNAEHIIISTNFIPWVISLFTSIWSVSTLRFGKHFQNVIQDLIMIDDVINVCKYLTKNVVAKGISILVNQAYASKYREYICKCSMPYLNKLLKIYTGCLIKKGCHFIISTLWKYYFM